MSALDRELAEAAAALARELGGDDHALRRAGDEMDRVQEQRLTQEQKKELLRRVNEIRARLREGGPEARQHQRRLMRFGNRAKGGKPGQRKGSGQEGAEFDPNAGIHLVPTAQNTPTSSGDPGPGGGKEAGDQPGPDHRGDPTSPLPAPGEDVPVAGHDTGEGSASAQVIAGAADEGFVAPAYENLYRDYKLVAEEVIGRDDIPPGYRLYVRRYFELIRPRSADRATGQTGARGQEAKD